METKYERNCRIKFYELLEDTGPIAGYSKSQVLTVMVVLGCDMDTAKKILDTHSHEPDWSEWTWTEFKEFFAEVVVGSSNG